jgi:hypothetical protein
MINQNIVFITLISAEFAIYIFTGVTYVNNKLYKNGTHCDKFGYDRTLLL